MPKSKITKAFVDQIPYTASGQIAYCDTAMPGFYLIVGMNTKTYAVQKDMNGKTVRYTIGRHGTFTPEQARKEARDKLHLMSLGINPNEEARRKDITIPTLEEIFCAYLSTRRNLKPRSKADYRYIIDRYLSDWKNLPIDHVTKEMIGSRHAAIAGKHGKHTANKAMRILRALFNFAQATYDICPVNPVSYLTHVKAWYREDRRRTYIKPNELKPWWKAVSALENDTYRDFLMLLLFTGLRRGEAAQLKWEDVDMQARAFTIPETKNNDPLTLPMSGFLYDLFDRRMKKYGNYAFVFPGPGKTGHLAEPKKGIYKVIEHCGIQFTCHDLRRTFITIAESLEISHYALKRLINHRVTDVTGGYIIVDVERLREPTEKIAEFILGKVNGVKIKETPKSEGDFSS